jgi:hypothetical protein
MRADEIPTLDPDLLYEECPACHCACDGCTTCFDEGLVVHACEEA